MHTVSFHSEYTELGRYAHHEIDATSYRHLDRLIIRSSATTATATAVATASATAWTYAVLCRGYCAKTLSANMLSVGRSAFAAARAPQPPPPAELPLAQINERNEDLANGIAFPSAELGESRGLNHGPIPVPVPPTNDLELSTWRPDSGQITITPNVDDAVIIRLPPGVQASFVGVYILHVVRGHCMINGAIMTEKSEPRTIYAPANHALPHIQSPNTQPCTVALRSCRNDIKTLGQVSSLFRGLWSSYTAIARQPGLEPLSQNSFQFVSLVATARFPPADQT